MPRCACIDIGSNTTRLLVVEDGDARPRELLAERAFTRLASSCAAARRDRRRRRSPRSPAVVARQVRLARRARRRRRCAIVATAAVREAVNGAALAAAVARGVRHRAGDPQRRGRGAAGVRRRDRDARRARRRACSGSSTSAAARRSSSSARPPAASTWSVSLPLGSSVVTDRDLPSDPPRAAELARAARASSPTPFARRQRAAAGGGLRRRRQRDARCSGSSASRSSARRWRAGCRRSSRARRPRSRCALGLHAERARLLPAGHAAARRGLARAAARRCSSPAAGCARASCSSSSRAHRCADATMFTAGDAAGAGGVVCCSMQCSAPMTDTRRRHVPLQESIRAIEPAPEPPEPPTDLDLHDKSLYFGRELSWLDFNDRVLQLAEDPSHAAARARQDGGDLELEPRRVLPDPRRRRARPDRRRARPSPGPTA